jgi:short subunit dehydrogenase-like uncharacterized protein
MKQDAEFDLVVYGASGFVGRLICEHLVNRTNAPPLRWAMAGRNADKLHAVRNEIGAEGIPLIGAQSEDDASLRSMASRTRAVLSATGPYMLHGSAVVAACVDTGTDYLDVAGELVWVHDMLERYEQGAQKSGARIIPCCGYDSVPSDLGVWLVQEEARRRYGRPADAVKGRVFDIQGSFSGGTIETVRQLISAAGNDPDFLAVLMDPFALTPGFRGPAQPSPFEIRYDRDISEWVAPFKMAPLNIATIHRSNLLQNQSYGRDFVYDEMMVFEGCADADDAANHSAQHGWSGLDILAGDDVPGPGEGPSREQRRSGFYNLAYLAVGDDGGQVVVRVSGDEDAGYGSTAKIAAETARCLLVDGCASPGGFLTPAPALGQPLVDRLKADAGLTFEIGPSPGRAGNH